MSSSLSALIDRLAQANEPPSRELDLDISELAGKHGTTAEHRDARAFLVRTGRMPSEKKWLPFYTASVDSALDLAKDADQRRHFLYHAADTCFHAKLDPAQHAPRLICLAGLRAIDSGQRE